MKNALTNKVRGLIVLAALLTALALPALSVDFPVTATLTLDPEAISGPTTVNAQLQVTNTSGADMTRPVSLYDPYGKLVSVFGKGGQAQLKNGEAVSVGAQVRVSQDMLDAGQVSFTLRWQDDQGQEIRLPVVSEVHFNGEKGNLRVVRSISPEVVRSGQTVHVTYELTNTGEVTIGTIKVQEKLVKNAKTVRSLAAGATMKVEFTAKMGSEDLTSGAAITFRPTSESPEDSVTVEDVKIPLAVKNLNATLSADKTEVNIGDTVTLTLVIRNEGNITYSDVTATDKNLGQVFEGLTIPAGGAISQEKTVTITGPSTFQLKLNLNDNTGMTNTYDTNQVSISAYDPEKELMLTLLLSSDKESLVSPPEDVPMSLVVTNSSNVDCKNVQITHAGVPIYTIPELLAGQSVTVKRDYTVSQAGQFRFMATTKDTVGNTVSFESNTLTLSNARRTPVPTAVPTPTIAPLVTLGPADYDDVSQPLRIMRSGLYTASWVLGGLTAAALVLFLISSIIRAKKRHDSNTAYDHLDLAEKRDYSQPAQDKEDGGDTPAAPTVSSGREEMEETPKEEPAQTDSDETPVREDVVEEYSPIGQSGGFRMTRDTQTDEFPVLHPEDAGEQTDASVPQSEAPAEEPELQEPADTAEEEAPAEDEDRPVRAGRRSYQPASRSKEHPQSDEELHERASLPDRRRRSRGKS